MLSAADYTQLAGKAPVDNLALRLHQTLNVITASWNVTDGTDSGAVTATPGVLLNDDQGVAAVVPKYAVILNVMIDNYVLPVSASNNGTIALRAQADGDLLATVDPDATNWTATVCQIGIPVFATNTTWIRMTADRRLSLVIATNAFTAGKLRFHVMFVRGISA
jgi:hypothetical protein